MEGIVHDYIRKDQGLVCGSIREVELVRRLGKSPWSFNSKMKRESFTVND